MESLIFEYKTLGVSWNLIASALVTACSVALDKEVCRGTIHNFQVSFMEILMVVVGCEILSWWPQIEP